MIGPLSDSLKWLSSAMAGSTCFDASLLVADDSDAGGAAKIKASAAQTGLMIGSIPADLSYFTPLIKYSNIYFFCCGHHQ